MAGDFSTNGAAHTSPGNRPGNAIPLFSQALIGRHIRCFAPSGLELLLTIAPRALPWAGISRPFGTAEGGLGYEYELSLVDILLVMTCQTSGGEILGIPSRISHGGNNYLHNQRMGKVIIKDRKSSDPGFFYYLLLWPDSNREQCVSASGTKILQTGANRNRSVRVQPATPRRSKSHHGGAGGAGRQRSS